MAETTTPREWRNGSGTVMGVRVHADRLDWYTRRGARALSAQVQPLADFFTAGPGDADLPPAVQHEVRACVLRRWQEFLQDKSAKTVHKDNQTFYRAGQAEDDWRDWRWFEHDFGNGATIRHGITARFGVLLRYHDVDGGGTRPSNAYTYPGFLQALSDHAHRNDHIPPDVLAEIESRKSGNPTWEQDRGALRRE